MPKINDVFAAARYRPSGFDYLRVILAMLVVFWHSFPISYGTDWTNEALATYWRIPVSLILPAFFALSGFLIAGSLERSPLPVFVGLRIIRIAPALVVETIVSAFLLGPLLTSLPASQYFESRATWSYMHNILGHDIQFMLPGVFANNPIRDTVNGQLWTVPYELGCYLALTAFACLRVVRSKYLFLVLGFIVPCLVQGYSIWHHPTYVVSAFAHVTGRRLLLSFLAGVVVYKFKSAIPYSVPLAIAALALFVGGLFSPYADLIVPLPVAYITVMLGVTNFRKHGLIRFGDLSYGIFLYGYVVQQAVAQLLPLGRTWYGNFAASIVISCGIAWLSWTYIEKPFQAFKKPIFALHGQVRSRLRQRRSVADAAIGDVAHSG